VVALGQIEDRGAMLKYREAGPAGPEGRTVSFRSAVQGRLELTEDAGGRELRSKLPYIDLRDATAREELSREDVLLAEPVRAIPQQDRRAVGRTVRAVGHGFDAVALGLPLLLSPFVREGTISIKVVALYVVLGTLMLWPTHRRGRHLVGPSEGLLSVITRIGMAPVLTSLLVTLTRLNDLSNARRFVDVVAIVQMLAVTLPVLLLFRLISYKMNCRARSQGYDLEDTLVVGTGPVGVDIARAMCENPQFGLVPCGFVDRYDDELTLPTVGRPEHLPAILRRTGIRHVVLAFGAADEQELVGIVRRVHDPAVKFYAVPRLFELGVSHNDVGHELDGLPLVPVRRPGASSNMWPAKRAFDLLVASLLLVLTSPVFLACALAVRLTSPGPVFFRQVRIGIGGRPFEILKFRTMRVNDDSSTQWSVDDDDRVTRAGRILRPTHLDELPQILNVLKGEMSLVGPRPERPHFVEQFASEIDGYHERHRVPVGITGWAQVNGYWGDTSIETRVRLDNRYIENWSLWRDLVIGLRTIPTLLGKRR
jgi:exopolysaccharide biosynthesis polyprenyl glycosylphosphotransferase